MTLRFWPLARGHEITSPFGARWGTTHWGVDFGWPGGAAGRPVHAVQGGTVTAAGPASGFGQWVLVDHPAADGGGTTVYGHIIPEVSVGQRVEAGQRIARINPDSNTNGGVAPHLHLEWHRSVWVPPGPDRLDPLPLLQGAQYPGEGTVPAPTPGGAVTGPVFGIDVSNHQGDFNFAGAAAEGYRFATHKVIEGTGYVDPFWPRARAEMGKHFPGRFGGYVFCRTNTSPAAEADFMMARLGDPAIPVQIDYEDTQNGGSGRDLAARVQAYRDRGARLLPVYLPRWFWRDHMGSPDLAFLSDLGIWNSNYVGGTGYGSALYDPASAGWQGFGGAQVAILQFTERAQVTDQAIDANAVRDEATLGRIFGNPAPAVNLIDEAARIAAPWIGARQTVGEADTRPPGSGKYAAFDNGTVYWKAGASFAMPVPAGGLLEAYAEHDYEAGPLGFPVRGHTVLDGGGVQAFEGGILYRQNGSEHGYVVRGAIGGRFGAAGWEAGPWGWPTSDETDGPDGTKVQTFQNVTATWSPDGVVLAKKEN